MSLIVQKYGGTSVGSSEKIKAVAERVLKYSRKGHQVVVVLSAMSGETDRLISLANSMQEQPDSREMDVLLSTGEQVTISLFAMAIKSSGFDAISFLGDQVKIQTSNLHTKARIQSVDTDKVKKHLDEGKIVVIAGFQGVDETGDITTLGRGGSDTTAV
ncbi:aspartate kinase, partial [Thermodesulfobacteriota bacterium]